jgi:hypothetical protein
MTLRQAFIAISVTANARLCSESTFCGQSNAPKHSHGRDERPLMTGENP